MRTAEFILPFEIPSRPVAKCEVKRFLEQIAAQASPPYGDDGQDVGVGFEWRTMSGYGTGGVSAVVKLARGLTRWSTSAYLISRRANTYLLECRIVYIRDGEPGATLRLKED